MVNRSCLSLFLITITYSFFSYAADIDFYDSDEEIKGLTSNENINPHGGLHHDGIIFHKAVPSNVLRPRALDPNVDNVVANGLDKMHLNDHDDT